MPFAGLVVALGALAGLHEARDVHLHVDVGVRHGERRASSGRRCPCASGSSAGGLRRRRPGTRWRCPQPVPARDRGRGAGACGAGAAGAAVRPATGAAPPVRMDSTTARTSSRVIRPPPPVPWICSGVEAVLAEESADRRGHAGIGSPVAARAAAAGRGRSGPAASSWRPVAAAAGRLVGAGAGRGPGSAGWLRRAAARGMRRRCRARPRGAGRGRAVVSRLDDRDLGVVRDGRALLGQDLLEDALERRRDLGVDLVGDDLEQRLVLVDVVAGLLQPLADRPLGDALAELGHRHLGHVRWSSESRDPIEA